MVLTQFCRKVGSLSILCVSCMYIIYIVRKLNLASLYYTYVLLIPCIVTKKSLKYAFKLQLADKSTLETKCLARQWSSNSFDNFHNAKLGFLILPQWMGLRRYTCHCGWVRSQSIVSLTKPSNTSVDLSVRERPFCVRHNFLSNFNPSYKRKVQQIALTFTFCKFARKRFLGPGSNPHK